MQTTLSRVEIEQYAKARADLADMQKERLTVTITDILIAEPFRNAEDLMRLMVGLRGAGLPE
jgi:hypothetical protein